MIWTRRLVLLAAALAVAGFACVAIGAPDRPAPEESSFGWYAYAPGDSRNLTDPQASFTSSLVHVPDHPELVHAGFVLLGLAILLTVGVIGSWALARARDA